MQISRRGLLGAGAAAAATGLFSTSALSRPPVPAKAKRAKNVIFCVADGMAISVITMLDHYLQLTEGRRSYWSTLLDAEDVTIGFQDTRSLNSVVTDSAAASSTWGSGRRIWNGMLNMYPDGTELRTLTSLMSEAGVKCGLVTTTTITHATPAGFAVNCVQRDLEHEIAEKYLKSGVDILMGGGNRSFAADKRKDKRDLYGDFAKAGFKVVKDRDSVRGLKSDKILGIFSESHLPFTVDRNNSYALQSGVPTLAEMAEVAIENLRGSKNGFLLQIEGGKVDHGAHANDLAAMLFDQLEFEKAVQTAVEFARQDGETLVIVTADHACGGPSLNGAGDEYFDSTAGLKTLQGMKSSYSPIQTALGGTPTTARVQAVIEEKLSLKLSEAEAGAISAAAAGNSPFKVSSFHGSVGATMAMILGNHSKVNWTSGNHTNDHVIVTALGPGSEQVGGLTSNTSFNRLLLAAKGLKHENPKMTFEEAAKHYEKLKEKTPTLAMNHHEDEEGCNCAE